MKREKHIILQANFPNPTCKYRCTYSSMLITYCFTVASEWMTISSLTSCATELISPPRNLTVPLRPLTTCRVRKVKRIVQRCPSWYCSRRKSKRRVLTMSPTHAQAPSQTTDTQIPKKRPLPTSWSTIKPPLCTVLYKSNGLPSFTPITCCVCPLTVYVR